MRTEKNYLKAQITFNTYFFDVSKLLEEFINLENLNQEETNKINFYICKVKAGKRLDESNIRNLKNIFIEKNLYSTNVEYFFNQRL